MRSRERGEEPCSGRRRQGPNVGAERRRTGAAATEATHADLRVGARGRAQASSYHGGFANDLFALDRSGLGGRFRDRFRLLRRSDIGRRESGDVGRHDSHLF